MDGLFATEPNHKLSNSEPNHRLNKKLPRKQHNKPPHKERLAVVVNIPLIRPTKSHLRPRRVRFSMMDSTNNDINYLLSLAIIAQLDGAAQHKEPKDRVKSVRDKSPKPCLFCDQLLTWSAA